MAGDTATILDHEVILKMKPVEEKQKQPETLMIM